MRRDEYVFAYLDDVYIIAPPERIVQIYDILKREFWEKPGIALHEGKTRVWNKAGFRPDGIQNLGENAWSPEGIKVLGTPIGTEEFVEMHIQKRSQAEKKLW